MRSRLAAAVAGICLVAAWPAAPAGAATASGNGYLPAFGRPALDRARALAAFRLRTAGGQAFDAVALDIESAHVHDVALRSRRLLDLSAARRAGAGSGYPLGAIVPASAGMGNDPAWSTWGLRGVSLVRP
jgi:hypothetical protein